MSFAFLIENINILLISFAGVHLLRRGLLWLYAWQVKEYRYDRFSVFLKEENGWKIVVPKTSIPVFGLLFIAPALSVLSFNLYIWISTFVYFILFCYSLYLLVTGQWKFPVFTLKMIILAITIISVEVLFVLWATSSSIGLYLPIIDLFLPFSVTVVVMLFQMPTSLLKRRIFAKAAAKRAQFKDLVVIGITGSYGKSSTKEFVATVLSKKYSVLKTPKNINSEIGIAQFINKKLSAKYEVFVCEMGAYKKGEIARSCSIAQPQIGIVTGVSNQHLSLFGSQQNIVEAKYELIDSLPKDGVAFFNGDDSNVFEMAKTCTKEKKIYGFSPSFDIWAGDIVSTLDGTSFSAHFGKYILQFQTPAIGIHNVQNILAAIAVGRTLQVPIYDIQSAVLDIKVPPSNIVKRIGRNGATVLDDSYNENMEGVFAAFKIIGQERSKKILIIEPLIELGKASEAVHQRIGREAAKIFDLVIFSGEFHFRDFRQGFLEGGGLNENLIWGKSLQHVREILEKMLKDDIIILIEGRVKDSIKKICFKQA